MLNKLLFISSKPILTVAWVIAASSPKDWLIGPATFKERSCLQGYVAPYWIQAFNLKGAGVYLFWSALLSVFCWYLKPRHGKKPKDEKELEKGKWRLLSLRFKLCKCHLSLGAFISTSLALDSRYQSVIKVTFTTWRNRGKKEAWIPESTAKSMQISSFLNSRNAEDQCQWYELPEGAIFVLQKLSPLL